MIPYEPQYIKPEDKAMIFVSDVKTEAPASFETVLQEKTYRALQALNIPFWRVETDEVVTMGDCALINQRLNMKMVKTLFLGNRRQTEFWLFITAGDKPFKSKEFSQTLNVPRLSFAPSDLMEKMLGTKIGAATIFSSLLDRDNMVKIVLDDDVVKEQWYGCSDGTTTGYMKIATEQVINSFLPLTSHSPVIIRL